VVIILAVSRVFFRGRAMFRSVRGPVRVTAARGCSAGARGAPGHCGAAVWRARRIRFQADSKVDAWYFPAAKAWRLGDDTRAFTVPDGYAVCDLIDAVIDDAR
jgi:hypothetical protein